MIRYTRRGVSYTSKGRETVVRYYGKYSIENRVDYNLDDSESITDLLGSRVQHIKGIGKLSLDLINYFMVYRGVSSSSTLVGLRERHRIGKDLRKLFYFPILMFFLDSYFWIVLIMFYANKPSSFDTNKEVVNRVINNYSKQLDPKENLQAFFMKQGKNYLQSGGNNMEELFVSIVGVDVLDKSELENLSSYYSVGTAPFLKLFAFPIYKYILKVQLIRHITQVRLQDQIAAADFSQVEELSQLELIQFAQDRGIHILDRDELFKFIKHLWLPFSTRHTTTDNMLIWFGVMSQNNPVYIQLDSSGDHQKDTQ